MKQMKRGSYTSYTGKHARALKSPRRQGWLRRYFGWFLNRSLKMRIVIIVVPILVVALLIPLLTYAYFARDIADKERLMNRNNTGIVLYDRNGEAFYSVGRAEHRDYLQLKDISDYTEKALIASEDKDFYKHGGFSIVSIFRAMITRVGGGSTITQQLAKNTVLSDERSLMRKYQELAIAIAIEQNYTKDEILELYLNSVYYGENAFGIEDAAETYFGKKASDLTLAESAMMIGLLPAPSTYSPVSGSKQYAKERQTTVLTRMVKNGFITEEEKTKALAEELSYREAESKTSIAPHYVEMVMNQLEEKYSSQKGEVLRLGYQVRTTLDLTMQKAANEAVANHVSYINAYKGSNAGVVAIDPKNGEIRALVGSADWENDKWGKVNIATSKRQPGSSFKPIYYAGALAEGTITPATVLTDKPINLGGWQPQNADRRFRGDVTVRSAISQSLNIPSIEVMEKYTIPKSVATARSLGIDSVSEDKQYGLSLSLGVAEASLVKMTNAYATFANAGQKYDTSVVQSIKDKFGKQIFKTKQQPTQAISSGGAFLISDILSDQSARAPVFGSSLSLYGRKAAVKTGTTDENRDAWTIGYTPSLAVGVWVGNNDNTPMSNGGSGMAGPIWRNVMNAALKNTKAENFTAPSSVVQRATCKDNYGIATNNIRYNTFMEYYLASALPSKTCTPEEPKIEVCVLEAKKVEQIKESDFDEKLHSKDLDKCKEKEEKTITVCNLTTNKLEEIVKDDFDEETHSKDKKKCDEPPAPDVTIDPIETPTLLTP